MHNLANIYIAQQQHSLFPTKASPPALSADNLVVNAN